MIKILSTAQIKELDAYTIRHEPVRSFDLMERACRAFVQWFTLKVDATNKIAIACGTGNNGGDGLGAARLLKESGYRVSVFIIRGGVAESDDFRENLSRLGAIEQFEVSEKANENIFEKFDVVIDAIFGSGLSRPVEGIYAAVIGCINNSKTLKIAIDMPSGLMADWHASGTVVKANFTVSFHLPKLAFFFPQSFEYTGEWVLVDIGLSKSFIKETPTDHYYLSEKDACKILRRRTRFDHKGTFGHALLIAGSYGKMGAAVLAARAALRAGVGLATVHAPSSANAILQSAVPEAMFEPDADERIFSSADANDKYAAIGIGPGLGQDPRSKNGMKALFEKYRKPSVIDADGLNLVSSDQSLRKLIPHGSILTPHPKEFERIVGKWTDDFDRMAKQKQLARELNGVIVLKGAFTSIASPDGKVFFNPTGNPGMATGGTGDALTGVLLALLAQGYEPLQAAQLGVYVHGLAGDLAAFEKGQHGLIASDLVEHLPFAFQKLHRLA